MVFGKLLELTCIYISYREAKEMVRRKTIQSIDPFIREESMVLLDKTINKGDVIKIKGIYGTEFKFISLVTNPRNGTQWVDCLELERGVGCGLRSFYPERVKPIVKRNKRVKGRRTRKASGTG